MQIRSYTSVGLLLMGIGTFLSILFYLEFKSAPLTSFGLACIILGFIAITLPNEVETSDALQILFQSVSLNVESSLDKMNTSGIRHLGKDVVLGVNTVIEGFDISKSVRFLPPRNGLIAAYFPLKALHPPDLDLMWHSPTQYFSESQEGLLLFPVGAGIAGIQELQNNDVESGLNFVLIEFAALCSSINVALSENLITLQMRGIKIKTESRLYSIYLGSIPSSLAACVIAAVTRKQIVILDERQSKEQTLVRFLVEQ